MYEALTKTAPAITARQRQVVELIAMGLSNEEIGAQLGISPRTVKAHSDVLRQKLGVSRRRQIPVAYRLLTGVDPLSKASARPCPAGGTDGTRARGHGSAGAGSPQTRDASLSDHRHCRQAALVLRQRVSGPRAGEHEPADDRSDWSTAPHHQATAVDAAAGRDVRPNHPAGSPRRLWQDHASPRVVRQPSKLSE